MFIDMDVDDIGVTADRTVFDIRLAGAFGQVQWNDDFLPARVTEVASISLQSCFAGIVRLVFWSRLVIEPGQLFARGDQLARPEHDGEGLWVGQTMVVSHLYQRRIRGSSQLLRILKGDDIVGAAVKDDRAGWDDLCRSPFPPSRTEEHQFRYAEIKVHGNRPTARASNDDLGVVPIELVLSGSAGEFEIIIVELGVDDLAAVLLEIGRFDAAWDTLPTVQEKNFHVSRDPLCQGNGTQSDRGALAVGD
jgi:hypothetical protein